MQNDNFSIHKFYSLKNTQFEIQIQTQNKNKNTHYKLIIV